MSTEPQWAGGKPSYSVSLTPEECYQEIGKVIGAALKTATADERVRLYLALSWAEHMAGIEVSH